MGEVANSRVYIGSVEQLLPQLLPKRRVIVITDSNIDRCHHALISSYEHIIIGLGEQAKNLTTLEKVYTQLMDMGADRSTFLLGIGGGIVTDITGFVGGYILYDGKREAYVVIQKGRNPFAKKLNDAFEYFLNIEDHSSLNKLISLSFEYFHLNGVVIEKRRILDYVNETCEVTISLADMANSGSMDTQLLKEIADVLWDNIQQNSRCEKKRGQVPPFLSDWLIVILCDDFAVMHRGCCPIRPDAYRQNHWGPGDVATHPHLPIHLQPPLHATGTIPYCFYSHACQI